MATIIRSVEASSSTQAPKKGRPVSIPELKQGVSTGRNLMSTSEVTRIRAQIDAEIEALNRVFHGFAVVANHQSITQRTARIGAHMQQLQTLVGKEEGAKIVMEALEALEEEPRQCPENQD